MLSIESQLVRKLDFKDLMPRRWGAGWVGLNTGLWNGIVHYKPCVQSRLNICVELFVVEKKLIIWVICFISSFCFPDKAIY